MRTPSPPPSRRLTSKRLPSGLQEELASPFGADFYDIGIAPTAAASAVTANGADAVTVGDAIDFGDTAYQPESGRGRELIAHELAHVVQQRCLMARGSKQRLLVSLQAFAWGA